MVDLVFHLINLLSFGNLSLYSYFNPISSKMFCHSSGSICLSLCICLAHSIFLVLFWTLSEIYCGDVPKTFVFLYAILLPIKPPGASVFFFFWIAFFKAVLKTSVADCLGGSKSFWLYLPLCLYFVFIYMLAHFSSKRQKKKKKLKYCMSRLNWIMHHFLNLNFSH